jgi:GNAT superfamily N-acetyltransferase
MTEDLRMVPANEATADDLDVIFEWGDPARCRCQWFKIRYVEWKSTPRDELARRLREQTRCGHPASSRTSGLVAYDGDEPAGWCAVEPRVAYPRILTAKVPWAGRDEDRSDQSVWSVTCFVTRTGFRHQGVAQALAAAAVGFARDRGARAVEGYPIAAAAKATSAELFVGTEGMFADAGFTAVSRPSARRVVMQSDLRG